MTRGFCCLCGIIYPKLLTHRQNIQTCSTLVHSATLDAVLFWAYTFTFLFLCCHYEGILAKVENTRRRFSGTSARFALKFRHMVCLPLFTLGFCPMTAGVGNLPPGDLNNSVPAVALTELEGRACEKHSIIPRHRTAFTAALSHTWDFPQTGSVQGGLSGSPLNQVISGCVLLARQRPVDRRCHQVGTGGGVGCGDWEMEYSLSKTKSQNTFFNV